MNQPELKYFIANIFSYATICDPNIMAIGDVFIFIHQNVWMEIIYDHNAFEINILFKISSKRFFYRYIDIDNMAVYLNVTVVSVLRNITQLQLHPGPSNEVYVACLIQVSKYASAESLKNRKETNDMGLSQHRFIKSILFTQNNAIFARARWEMSFG